MFVIEYSLTQYIEGKQVSDINGIVPGVTCKTEETANEDIKDWTRSKADTVKRLMPENSHVDIVGDNYLEWNTGLGITFVEQLNWIEL